MEKLQAALNKAREQRGQAQADAAPAPAPDPHPPVRPSLGRDMLWQQLPPFEVSREVLKKHRVVTQHAGASDAAPFDILRTKLLVQMRKNNWRRLAITSPTPTSGKTTMACNLALGLGRQSEMRSMLLDMDLRDPSVHEFFDIRPEYGIEDVLQGTVRFEDQAMRFGDNVAVSMTCQPDRDPARILHAQETVDILDDIEERYQPDLMIFDLPSVLVNDDTRSFLKNVDCVLIVIRAGVTRYSQFDTCEQEIAEQTNVIGTVLNAYMNVDTDNY